MGFQGTVYSAAISPDGNRLAFTAPTSAMLTITNAGTGAGLVTSNPSQIVCGSTCSGSFERDAVVNLTAAVATGSIFAGWSGNCSPSKASTCAVTMDAAKMVKAHFRALPVKKPRPSRTPPSPR